MVMEDKFMNNKEGLDCFPTKCTADKAINLVMLECGLKSHSIIYSILKKIYGEHGYYCEWNKDMALLISLETFDRSNKAINRTMEIVNCCAKHGVFSLEQLKQNKILTSKEIQENFFLATKRRTSVKVKQDYLLVSADLLPDNVIILDKNIINIEAAEQQRKRGLNNERIKGHYGYKN